MRKIVSESEATAQALARTSGSDGPSCHSGIFSEILSPDVVEATARTFCRLLGMKDSIFFDLEAS